jgi:hypothetical protein
MYMHRDLSKTGKNTFTGFVKGNGGTALLWIGLKEEEQWQPRWIDEQNETDAAFFLKKMRRGRRVSKKP